MTKVTDQPEFNLAVFAFLLNYPWEFLQVPLYLGMANAPHWEGIKRCTLATVGDALIMLVCYWAVVVVARTRWWVLRPSAPQLTGFAASGVVIAVVVEHFALQSNDPNWSWRYAPSMPIVPLIGTGLAPLLQWLVLPPLVVWFVKRQLAHLGSRRGPRAR